eukprot:UN28108
MLKTCYDAKNGSFKREFLLRKSAVKRRSENEFPSKNCQFRCIMCGVSKLFTAWMKRTYFSKVAQAFWNRLFDKENFFV